MLPHIYRATIRCYHTHTLCTLAVMDYVACTAALLSISVMQVDRFTCVALGGVEEL